jgi:TRAP-type C4-dicarboxylate transport system permease small subunit
MTMFLRHLCLQLNNISNILVGSLLLLTVVINVAQVFYRYVLNDPIFWTEEAIRYVTVWFTFLGVIAASYSDEHMEMNLFADLANESVRRLNKLIIQFCVLIFSGIISWQGIRYCMLSGSQTSPTMEISMIYVYSSIAVGGILLIVITLNKIVLLLFPAGS